MLAFLLVHEYHSTAVEHHSADLACCWPAVAGTYSSFPAGVPGMHGQLTDAQQQRLISQMNHMLYSRLLKVR